MLWYSFVVRSSSTQTPYIYLERRPRRERAGALPRFDAEGGDGGGGLGAERGGGRGGLEEDELEAEALDAVGRCFSLLLEWRVGVYYVHVHMYIYIEIKLPAVGGVVRAGAEADRAAPVGEGGIELCCVSEIYVCMYCRWMHGSDDASLTITREKIQSQSMPPTCASTVRCTGSDPPVSATGMAAPNRLKMLLPLALVHAPGEARRRLAGGVVVVAVELPGVEERRESSRCCRRRRTAKGRAAWAVVV